MHDIKQHNELLRNDIHNKKYSNCTPSSIRNSETNDKINCVKTSSVETVTKNQTKTADQHENSAGVKTSCCSSSTDSGVNICDTDEKLPSSPTSSHLNSNPSSISSSEKHKVASPCYKQFRIKNENTNQDNSITNYKGNECKINNCNNKQFILNGDNNVENDDANDDINSEKFDNKFKVVDSSNADSYTRYQSNQNIIESKNVINISQQQNLTTLISTETPTSATTATNKEKSSLQHNEFLSPQQRLANNYVNNQPSNMFHGSESPVVSIRSINSTIITSDSESDSDLYSSSEDVRENYVIKKLGTQVTYSPNDPGIPKINSGHTVLNQKVIANDSQVPLSPLATLAAIGDSIGAAQALGPLPSSVAQRPQIGSIALSNSTDVTFGDKHFYEGPVTIQQFLIDSSDKRKETVEKDDLTFEKQNNEPIAKNSKTINSSEEKSSGLFECLLKRKKVIIPSGLAFMALLIVATILGSKMINDGKSKLLVENSEESRNVVPINSTIDSNNDHIDDYDDSCNDNGTLCLIDRDSWRAHPQKSLDRQVLPLHRVVISHTASEPCDSIKICAERVRVIQEYHMNSLGWADIGYNFLIGSGGRVYVGRGWDYVGAHTKGYNYDSVGITFIGTYISTAPSEVQLKACLSLLDEGLRLMKLAPNYRLYGARQLGATESPGEMLYKKIKKWKHWSANVNLT